MIRHTRIRDLVHGTVYLTELETKIVDHPLFQRLKHIRQNDIAYAVYPSINTSRFEHVLGACHVAGMMAENMKESPKWQKYARELKKLTGVSKEEFVELVRLYALTHDIGHFPFSHLFEEAVRNLDVYARADSNQIVTAWFGPSRFTKLHEAFSALMIQRIAQDVAMPEHIHKALLRIMTTKVLEESDILYVVKSIVDSQIDADRIDFVARDAKLTGGEYGNHDINRLCTSVFIDKDHRGWHVAYSEKAIPSMEALLLDRYRAYAWIFFHQKVATMKMFMQFLIGVLFERGIITPSTFTNVTTDNLLLLDDIWLWGLILSLDAQGDTTIEIAKRAILFREKANFTNLWKNRPQFHERNARIKKAQGARGEDKYEYVRHIEEKIGIRIFTFETGIEAIKDKPKIPLYSETGKGGITGQTLEDVSCLVASLNKIASEEPEYYRILVAPDIGKEANKKREEYFRGMEDWYARIQ